MEIDLAENRLSELPESIENLTKVKKLFLYNNNLRKLPESIGNLGLLEEIKLRENDLEFLPESVKNRNNRSRPDFASLLTGCKEATHPWRKPILVPIGRPCAVVPSEARNLKNPLLAERFLAPGAGPEHGY